MIGKHTDRQTDTRKYEYIFVCMFMLEWNLGLSSPQPLSRAPALVLCVYPHMCTHVHVEVSIHRQIIF